MRSWRSCLPCGRVTSSSPEVTPIWPFISSETFRIRATWQIYTQRLHVRCCPVFRYIKLVWGEFIYKYPKESCPSCYLKDHKNIISSTLDPWVEPHENAVFNTTLITFLFYVSLSGTAKHFTLYQAGRKNRSLTSEAGKHHAEVLVMNLSLLIVFRLWVG